MSGTEHAGGVEAALRRILEEDPGVVGAAERAPGRPGASVRVVEHGSGTDVEVALCTSRSVPTAGTLRRLAARITASAGAGREPEHPVRVRLHVTAIE